jgi:hypothetical protein
LHDRDQPRAADVAAQDSGKHADADVASTALAAPSRRAGFALHFRIAAGS